MAIAKKLNIGNIFIFLFLVLFPFGQVIRIGILQPIDIIAGLGAVYTLLWKLPKPGVFKYLGGFLGIAAASWVFSVFIFYDPKIFYGLLYLFRLFAYFYFFIYVWNFAKIKNNRRLLADSLLAVSAISAVLGWVQFVAMPDIKPLFVWGWDMHLFRLVGTFLDPGYLSLIITFGLILSTIRLIEEKSKRYYLITFFLVTSLAFTYSRAGYLAALAGMVVIAVYKKAFKKLLVFGLTLIIIVLMLPTAKNSSIILTRTFSVLARIENYKATMQVFSKSPVFGIGYNNMCLAFNKYVGYQSFSSHSCSGSDSSFLYILATTGIAGALAFIYGILMISKKLSHVSYKVALVSSFAALLIHSFFANSVFYPWILGFIIILTAIAI